MILDQRRISKKQFWKYVSDPTQVSDPRLRKELQQVAKEDIVYSPNGVEMQYARGIHYRTEKQLKAEYEKTPDVLLHRPIDWNGSKNYWIESKAIVGDPVEIRRHVRKQLGPYSEIFGDGIVVYWFGFVEDVDIEVPNGVNMVDERFFLREDIIPLTQSPK